MVVNLQFSGGRGANSGLGENPYGSQYHTVLEHENIKFVTNTVKNYEPLMETMTLGRTYVQVGGKEIVRIVFMDEKIKETRLLKKIKERKNGMFIMVIFIRKIQKKSRTIEHSR